LRAAGFRDAFESAGVEPAPTAPAERPDTRIDWVWLRGHTALDAQVSDAPGSDHRLVAATVRVVESSATTGALR
jgi:endonuclease/exonuclease/phosphatase (EEP) superfamily protein YafD